MSLFFPTPGRRTCLIARASFPSARNAHQRTVGALLSMYHRALCCGSPTPGITVSHTSRKTCVPICEQPLDSVSISQVGRAASASKESGGRLICQPSYLDLSDICRRSQPFRVLTQSDYGSRLFCIDGMQTTEQSEM
jgi:hypothetical protein